MKKKVVVIGGGTGTYGLLRGLKHYSDQVEITAIVTMTDDGGSTGRLRDSFGYLPVGDVRQALAALAPEDEDQGELLRQLFLYRYDKGESGLQGHNFGNLFLTALTEIVGSEVNAIKAASTLLRVRGAVIPVTTHKTTLVAKYDNGAIVSGEHMIDEQDVCQGERIVDLSLSPKAYLYDEAAAALAAADIVVFGPGDLYTSIISNCIVEGFQQAISKTSAQLVYVSNLMSKNCQTKGLDAAGHVLELEKYLRRKLDKVIIHEGSLPNEVVSRYLELGDSPIDTSSVDGDPRIVRQPCLDDKLILPKGGDALKRSYIRHDGNKLAKIILSLCQ